MNVNIRHYLLSIYVWGFFIITVIPLFVLFMVIWGLLTPFDQHRRVTHSYAVLWGRLYLGINPWWNITFIGKDKIEAGKTYVIISNHQSLLDIPILMQLPIHFRWVSKIELFRTPVIGWVSRMNKYVPVQRGDKESVLYMMEACKNAIKNKISIFIFPEGTRTEDKNLKPFKEGAFILAKETNSPILIVALDGASQALPKNGLIFLGKQMIRVSVVGIISPDVVENSELNALIERANDIINSELVSMRSANV